MKKAVIFFLLSFPCLIFGQGTSIDKIEQEIRPHVPDGIRLDKLATDLNGDGKEDLIYSYECAEGLICIRIYLQINGEYVKQLDTASGPYTLETFSGDKKLQLTESCCGEGLFRLYQTYRFDQTSIRLVENYIVKSFAKDHGNPSVRGWVSGRYTEKE